MHSFLSITTLPQSVNPASVRKRVLVGLACIFFSGGGVWANEPAPDANLFNEAVEAYHTGHYLDAQKSFNRLHKAHPENSRMTYYLAIAEAQLGHFKQAKTLYQEILTLDPQGEAAKLAQEGLGYLPPDSASLDLPPRFQASQPQAGAAVNSLTAQLPSTGANTPNPATTNSPSMQDLMMWQMMMSQAGNNNNNANGFNPWMYMMMAPQQGSDPNNKNPMGNIDPNIMSTMMMNQMMQNFTLQGDSNDNH